MKRTTLVFYLQWLVLLSVRGYLLGSLPLLYKRKKEATMNQSWCMLWKTRCVFVFFDGQAEFFCSHCAFFPSGSSSYCKSLPQNKHPKLGHSYNSKSFCILFVPKKKQKPKTFVKNSPKPPKKRRPAIAGTSWSSLLPRQLRRPRGWPWKNGWSPNMRWWSERAKSYRRDSWEIRQLGWMWKASWAFFVFWCFCFLKRVVI